MWKRGERGKEIDKSDIELGEQPAKVYTLVIKVR